MNLFRNAINIDKILLFKENNNGNGFKFMCRDLRCNKTDCNGHWTGDKNTWETRWCEYKLNSPDQWSLTYYDNLGFEKKRSAMGYL